MFQFEIVPAYIADHMMLSIPAAPDKRLLCAGVKAELQLADCETSLQPTQAKKASPAAHPSRPPELSNHRGLHQPEGMQPSDVALSIWQGEEAPPPSQKKRHFEILQEPERTNHARANTPRTNHT